MGDGGDSGGDDELEAAETAAVLDCRLPAAAAAAGGGGLTTVRLPRHYDTFHAMARPAAAVGGAADGVGGGRVRRVAAPPSLA